MYKILEIPLIQLKTEEKDKKVFNIQKYAIKLENINYELEHLYYTINENKITLEKYLKDNYNEILKFTIYFNLPYFNLHLSAEDIFYRRKKISSRGKFQLI
jgi:hypothetical protein